jgi:sugar lactone lactonase YvrE
MDVEVVLRAKATLGEGPVWDDRSGEVLFVDILERLVHRWHPGSGRWRALELPSHVSAVALRENGGLVLALQDGVYLLGPDSDDEDDGRGDGAPRVRRAGIVDDDVRPGPDPVLLTAMHKDRPGLRLNEGKCDPQGRFWVGSMNYDQTEGVGSLYRVTPEGHVGLMVERVTISNGLAWTSDGRTMYYIDTPTRGVDAFDFDPASGEISGRRRVVSIREGAGNPDGMTIDAEEHLLVALWGGGAIHRYAPDGQLVDEIPVPASQVSSCEFGGTDLRDLYITSARDGLSEEQLGTEPDAGSLFRVRMDVPGRPAARFRG